MVRAVLARTRARLAGQDLMLASAGATLYGALAVVPSLLVAIATAQLVLGRSGVERFGRAWAHTLPTAMGADQAVRALLSAGLGLGVPGVVFAAVMGSAYGDGLARALRRFAPTDVTKSPAWWLRAATLALLGLAPLTLSGLMLASPYLGDLNGRNGLFEALRAAYASLNIVWVLTWAPLAWTFRVVGPGRPSWRAAFVGALVTGAFVSGFLQGFVLFLALPVDLARPFGGLFAVGAGSALLLWLWVLHVVVCMGYALTWAVEEVWQGRTFSRQPRLRG